MTLPWKFSENRDSETARFRVCGIEAVVMDADGDRSLWQIRQNKRVIAEGQEDGYKPYHFHAAIQQAEDALRAEVRRRKELLATPL